MALTEEQKSKYINLGGLEVFWENIDKKLKNLPKDYISVSHSELKTLRDNSQLVPGSYYRIIDFKTTVNYPYVYSANKKFDIVVTAISNNKLSENAKALWTSTPGTNDVTMGDSIAYNHNLTPSSWGNNAVPQELRDLVGDKVIKSIYWTRDMTAGDVILGSVTYTGGNHQIHIVGMAYIDSTGQLVVSDFHNGRTGNMHVNNTYTFTAPKNCSGGKFYIYIETSTEELDASAKADINKITYTFSENEIASWELKYCLDNDTNRFNWANTNGTGVIYYMKDRHGNECPYDFKNIMYGADGQQYYTFDYNVNGVHYDGSTKYPNLCYNNIISACVSGGKMELPLNYFKNNDGSACHTNKIDTNSSQNIFGPNCSGNVIGSLCTMNTFGPNCSKNILNIECSSNKFADGCSSNTLGAACSINEFNGTNSSYNILGNMCNNNTFGSSCVSNTLGSSCSSNVFGNNIQNTTMGNMCGSNAIGDNCVNNKFGDNCSRNLLGSTNECNTFGDASTGNKFGSNCSYNNLMQFSTDNKFGDFCQSNTFDVYCTNNDFASYSLRVSLGKKCQYNKFTTSAAGTTKRNYTQCVHVGDNCSYNYFWNSNTNSVYMQNIHIYEGVSGTSSSYNAVELPVGSTTPVFVTKTATDVLVMSHGATDADIENLFS